MTCIPHPSTLIWPAARDTGLPLIQQKAKAVDSGLCEFMLMPDITFLDLSLLNLVSRSLSLLTGLLSLGPAVIHGVLE
jgi:hypothetical protein